VFLTAQGRELAAKLRGVAAAHVNETIGNLPDEDLEELARLLDDLSASISQVLEHHESACDGTAGEEDA
jgi:DNA-binding MarR family transcriptional regulator